MIAWFVHLFRMPMFFVIAGFFAALLVRKRGIAGMLRNGLAFERQGEHVEAVSWWRRRESNPRPKRFVRKLLHA